MNNKSSTTATLLSVLITGGGQFYNGQIGKGFGMLAAAIFLGVLTMGILAIPFWIWSIIDAYQVAEKDNKKFNYQLNNNNTQPVKSISKSPIQDANSYNNQNDDWIPKAPSTLSSQVLSVDMKNSNPNSISVSIFKEQMIKYKKLYEDEMLSFTEFTQMKANYFKELEKYGIKESKSDFLLELSPLISNSTINDEDLKTIKEIVLKGI